MALSYQTGFCNEFATEALPHALPALGNSPQRCPYGLYAEQYSGTAFTVPRHASRRSWLYRIRPAAVHEPFERIEHAGVTANFDPYTVSPNQLRWDPLPLPNEPTDFVRGIITIGGNGSPAAQRGCAIHWYAANESMLQRFFCNADGELLIVPQLGRLRLATELGILEIAPLEIAVLPRGLRFRVELLDQQARGYLCENFGAALRLPDLGPIGSNGLAHARDFQTPVAAYEDRAGDFELMTKFMGSLWSARIDHSPLDVVAWLAMTNTFRPPWFHSNCASEFMGLIEGVYDAKESGFLPGGASLHNCMSGHGPDAATVEKAIRADTMQPEYVGGTMAFMFETRAVICPTPRALALPQRQRDYQQCWRELPVRFSAQHAPSGCCDPLAQLG